jgi:uncharacterized protein (TIGR02598 family)
MEPSAHSARSLPRSHRPSRHRKGFSLVEVVLSIGIVAFAFVSVLGMIPTGLSTFRQAMDTSVGSQIAQRVINDALQTDFDVLVDEDSSSVPQSADYTFRAPDKDGGAFRYFDEEGTEIVVEPPDRALTSDESRQVVYWVNMRIKPQTDGVQTGADGNLKHLATVTVQVANNPGNQALGVGSDNLLTSMPGVSVHTYSALAPRNK